MTRGLGATAAARCPGCAAPTPAGDRFCERCGTDLQTLRAPDGNDHVAAAVTGAAGLSDRGHVRPRNEDAMALGRDPQRGARAPVAAVVCDGVSSAPGSERAARAAADATLAVLLHPGPGTDRSYRVRAAVAAGADAAAALGRAGTRLAPSCTLVCGLHDAGDPTAPVLTVAWVGDSRAYWLAGGAAPGRLLTVDHIAATAPPGTLDPHVVAARPDAITRWLGAGSDAEPDVVTLTPAGPGALLLCTDGLWKYLPDPAALAALALPALYDGGPPAAATALVAAALHAGGEDNVTVAVLPVSPVPVPPVPRRAP